MSYLSSQEAEVGDNLGASQITRHLVKITGFNCEMGSHWRVLSRVTTKDHLLFQEWTVGRIGQKQRSARRPLSGSGWGSVWLGPVEGEEAERSGQT